MRTVKTAMRNGVGKTLLNFVELATVCTEFEAVVNSRPLLLIESDIGELCALTPADLVIGRGHRIGHRISPPLQPAQTLSEG